MIESMMKNIFYLIEQSRELSTSIEKKFFFKSVDQVCLTEDIAAEDIPADLAQPVSILCRFCFRVKIQKICHSIIFLTTPH